uniref:Protein kinase domain-containing protein n=1 Tax=Pristionchus pacificus TaxID=54126 RepID=A0A2A6CY97_PRIPA|eukprot:PDM83145.1 protein kinase [Pristionchus pacificus]
MELRKHISVFSDFFTSIQKWLAVLMGRVPGDEGELYKSVYLPANAKHFRKKLCHFALAEWLAENATPESRSLTRMKTWFKQMVQAVDYIHEKNLIHRDLKVIILAISYFKKGRAAEDCERELRCAEVVC